MTCDQHFAIYTVFDKESESEVKKKNRARREKIRKTNVTLTFSIFYVVEIDFL